MCMHHLFPLLLALSSAHLGSWITLHSSPGYQGTWYSDSDAYSAVGHISGGKNAALHHYESQLFARPLTLPPPLEKLEVLEGIVFSVAQKRHARSPAPCAPPA